MPLTHDQVLQFVKQKGPSVPNDIRQGLKAQDNFIVGAILSELLGQGKLKLSHLSLGTSRFYYDPEHPEALESVGMHLNEKDVRAFQLLKDKKVLRNSELEPIMRVAMTNIPDYSRALRVPTANGEELFWHYYLVAEDDAFEQIKERYLGEAKPAAKPQSQPQSSSNQPQQPTQVPSFAPSISQEPQQAPTQQPQAAVRFGKKQPKAPAPQNVEQKTSTEPKPKAKRAARPAVDPLSEGFGKQLREFFDKKNIGVSHIIKSAKTEVTALVTIPSAVGDVTYFCKAKAKKSTSDGDLASAMLEAQQHKLPLFYVAGGSLSKKAQELITTQRVVVVTPWA